MGARPDKPQTSRLAGIEGLRALAAGSIVVYHVWLYGAPNGQPVDLGYLSRFALPHLASGVTLFFTLSGFLLYRPLAVAVLDGSHSPSTKAYFRNRVWRIIPAYWVILSITGFILGAVLIRSGPDEIGLGNFSDAPHQFIRNALFIQNFSGSSLDSGIGPAWSLAVEVIFYLMLPLFGWIAVRVAARLSHPERRFIACLTPPAIALVIGWITAVSIERGIFGDSLTREILARSFFNHADLFSFGMALAVLHAMVERGNVRLPKLWRGGAFLILTAAVGTAVLMVDRGLIFRYQGSPLYESLTSVACAMLIAIVVLPSERLSPATVIRLLESRPLVVTGLASYSLFLWHEPVVRWLSGHGLTYPGSGVWVNLMLVAVVAGTLSAGTYWMVEKPVLARKALVRSRNVADQQGLATVPQTERPNG